MVFRGWAGDQVDFDPKIGAGLAKGGVCRLRDDPMVY